MILVGLGLLVTPGAPGVSFAGLLPVETDARAIPWSTVRRLALEAGLFPPAYHPVSEGELADLLTAAMDEVRSGAAGAFDNDDEVARLRFQTERSGVSGRACARSPGRRPSRWNVDGHQLRSLSPMKRRCSRLPNYASIALVDLNFLKGFP